MRRPNVTPEWEGQRHGDFRANDLMDLQTDVLDALEAAGHPCFEAARKELMVNVTTASDSERKAWLAVYGPLTDILTD